MTKEPKVYTVAEILERIEQLDRLRQCDSREQPKDWYAETKEMLEQLQAGQGIPIAEFRAAIDKVVALFPHPEEEIRVTARSFYTADGRSR